MIVDQTGSLASMKRHEYLPFGEELSAGVGNRTTTEGYSGDLVRQKFTSKERDNETGLDFFEARYYTSTQGRFTSADPLQASAKRRNPQTWNRYTYGLNNPLRFTDPDGEDVEDESGDVYLRTKIKTTEVTVQERGGGQIVREAKITITESQTDAPQKTSNDIDDCHRFATIVDQLAQKTNVIMATADSLTLVQDFMDALARRFTEFSGASYLAGGMATLGFTNDSFKATEFGSTGFKMDYFEEDFLTPDGWVPANQVRHTIGGLIMGYVRGEGTGLDRMNSREDLTIFGMVFQTST